MYAFIYLFFFFDISFNNKITIKKYAVIMLVITLDNVYKRETNVNHINQIILFIKYYPGYTVF